MPAGTRRILHDVAYTLCTQISTFDEVSAGAFCQELPMTGGRSGVIKTADVPRGAFTPEFRANVKQKQPV